MPSTRHVLLFALILGALFAVAWWAYAPGLHGPFLFDDFANLPTLGASGPVDTWPTFWRYITSGHADPTGRPVALLSFLLDAHDWPANPLPFKRTNLILHLFNAALLALLLRRLGQALFGALPSPAGRGCLEEAGEGTPKPATSRFTRTFIRLFGPPSHPQADSLRVAGGRGAFGRIDLAALLGAALWLLHPLLVSTTLYIVQREAMLAATFTLLGLLLWLHGRTRLLHGHRISGLLWMLLGLGGCTLLGVLSKANGALLPALALVIEYTVLRAATAHAVRCPQTSSVVGAGTAATGSVESSADGAAPSAAPVAAVPAPTKAQRSGELSGATVPAPTKASGGGALLQMPRLYRRAMLLLGWLPTALIAIYLLVRGWKGLVYGISSIRPWTLGQRLLTEPRVLMDYLDLLWLPRPFTPGLFNDQIHASTALLSPVTTLPAILAVLGLIVGAWLARKRWPALALAVLFYFVGQSLESSTVALELYFEHRNYLPAVLMFWPLALWLCGVRRRPAPVGAGIAATGTTDRAAPSALDSTDPVAAVPAPTKAQESDESSVAAMPAPTKDRQQPAGDNHRAFTTTGGAEVWGKAKLVLAIILLVGLALMTHARAGLWGNAHDQAMLWARLNPASPRAQANASQALMSAGRPDLAAARLRPALIKAPDQVQLALNLFGAECQMGHVDAKTLTASRTALRTTRDPGSLLAHWFGRAISQSAHPPCPQLTLATITGLVDAGLANNRLNAGRRQDLYHQLGVIALARGDGDAALAEFNRATDQQPRMSGAFEQAALLGSAGFPRQGLAHLDHYATEREQHHPHGFDMRRVHAWVLRQQHYWDREGTRLRATLRADAAQQTD